MISLKMRLPAIRVLIAVLLGLWSSLCCCQARAIIGQSCGGGQATQFTQAAPGSPRSCCHSHDEQRDRGGDNHDPDGGDGDSQRKSPVCPSCQSPQGTAGPKLESGPQDWERARVAVVTFVLADILPAPEHAPLVLSTPGRDSTPAAPRANRDALRWHCALIV